MLRPLYTHRSFLVVVYLQVASSLADHLLIAQGFGGGPSRSIDRSFFHQETGMSEGPSKRLDAVVPAVLFADPFGSGRTNSTGITVIQYVDHDSSSAVQDYRCGQSTYDGHQGTDIEIMNFYEMDEGVPVLAAAPGTVVNVHDGEFDRRTEWVDSVTGGGNFVMLRHSDGTDSYYFHLRKGSVRVRLTEAVQQGDTLGMVGSSGRSSGPHLHFEVRKDSVIDPYQGACGPTESSWISQLPHVWDYPFLLFDHGVTTLPLNWPMMLERPPTKSHVTGGDTVYFWVRARNIRQGDTLRWDLYRNDSFWGSYGYPATESYASSYWYMYWRLPWGPDTYGSWEARAHWKGEYVSSDFFQFDADSNNVPAVVDTVFRMAANTTLNGAFRGEDPDGSLFWYSLVDGPLYGSLSQSGGRRRRFSYTPDPGFTGLDTVWLRVSDDELADSEVGMHVFDVEGPTKVRDGRDRPDEFWLGQNYPNPFNPITDIRYRVGVDSRQTTAVRLVRLIVFDLLGREVAVLVDGEKTAGTHRVAWDASGFPSGIYYYRLRSGDFVETRKLLLLR